MPKIKSIQASKELPVDLFQDLQPRSLHVIPLQPDDHSLLTPESQAAASSLLSNLDAVLNLSNCRLLSINYAQGSNSRTSLSILASKQSADFIRSFLPHLNDQHHDHRRSHPSPTAQTDQADRADEVPF